MRQELRAASWIGAVLALLLAGYVSQADAKGAATYPKELHGYWIPKEAQCPQAGESFGGDVLMDIGSDQLQGYEEVSEPVKVDQVSEAPKAWRIESRLDIGPSGFFVEDEPKIYVLGDADVTVVSETRAYTLRRCTSGGPSAPISLCDQSLTWEAAAPRGTVRVLPTSTSEEGGRTYHFDLAGRGGLRTLHAECGWAPYSECDIQVTQADGRKYGFTDLSTFGLWERQGALYLLYRIVSPSADADAFKRRVVRIGNPPIEVCNQIGDYSRLM